MQLSIIEPKSVRTLRVTTRLPAVAALPATAMLPAVATEPATATEPADATEPATAMLPAVAAEPATATEPAVATDPITPIESRSEGFAAGCVLIDGSLLDMFRQLPQSLKPEFNCAESDDGFSLFDRGMDLPQRHHRLPIGLLVEGYGHAESTGVIVDIASMIEDESTIG